MDSTAPGPPQPHEPPRALLIATRVGLPVLIAIVGVVLIVMGHGDYTSVFASRNSLLSAVGVGFIVISLMVALLNWMLRLNSEDAGDREKEEQAREYFRRTGHWPDES